MADTLATELTGAQKAAILLLKLGHGHSSKVMKLLGDSEVTQITAEIVIWVTSLRRSGALLPRRRTRRGCR